MEREDVENIAVEVSRLIDDLQRHGMEQFKGAVKNSKLRLTGALEDSIDVDVKLDLNKAEGEVTVSFNHYWRFKDMKNVVYDNGKFLHVDAIRNFVKELGVGKFPFVQGYESKATISQEKAIDRIVRAIVFYRRKFPKVETSGRYKNKKKLYSKTKNAYFVHVKNKVMNALGVNMVITLKGEWAIFKD